MISSLFRRAAILLTVFVGLAPTPAPAQFGGFGPGGAVGLGGFGGLAGLPGGFNVVNGFGPLSNSRIWSSSQPILSVYNGQTSLMQIQQFQWLPTNVQVVQAGGQVAFVPQYQPLPFGQNWPIQAVQSPNGLQRLSTAPILSNVGPGPLFPIATFINPVFEGGAMGAAVPFTQFIGQPGFNTIGLNTTVSVPLGGYASLGNWRMGGQNRNAFGAPLLGGMPGMAPFFNNLQFGGNLNFVPVMAPRVP
jgi:hypothetical protein